MARKLEYRDARTLALALMVSAGAYGAGQLLMAVLSFAMPPLSYDLETEPATPLFSLAASVGFLSLAALITGSVLHFLWAWRVSVNAHSFGRTMQHGQAATIFWFFIPFVYLVMPLLVMKEIWDESGPLKDRRGVILGFWWAGFLVTNFGLLFTIAPFPGLLGLIVHLLFAAAAGAYILMVHWLTKRQQMQHLIAPFSEPAEPRRRTMLDLEG